MKLAAGRTLWSALAAGTAMSVVFCAGAAAQTTTETITVVGERSSYGQEAISTATKTDTLLRDTPQAITVITRDLIDDQGMRSMADVVRYAPGVSMGQGEGHRDAPTLRGNSSTADFFVDGVRDDVQYYRDLYNAERIEVLKGANAMIFGRGGGGGVINRVTEQADHITRREIDLQLGSYDQRRIALDLGGGVSESAALRLNAMYEDSESYRDYVELERYGLNPTATFDLSPTTSLRLGVEHFHDERTVDRGVPSFNGRPAQTDEGAFFGNPDASHAEATVNLAQATFEHAFSDTLRLRNHTLFADYDKMYANVHANSPVDALGNVTLQAYRATTERQNFFNQTDLIWQTQTGAIDHTILVGVEVGRQESDNTRNPNSTPGIVNIANPTVRGPFTFATPLQNDNTVQANLAAIYVQDQIALSEQVQVIAGLRYDRFDLDFDNHITGSTDFSRTDDLISPRLGLVFKPIEPLSLYASYSVSYLPQSGDQFSSLTATSAALEPEEFENIEIGAKWDILPNLALSAAIYRLDRTNTTAIDPISSLTVLTGEQRSEGFELGLAGAINDRWEIIASYANQEAEITSTTTAAPAGRKVPLVPEQTFSLWNNVQLTPAWGVGLGITHQTDMYASISNAVTLPGFTRVDAAVYYTLSDNTDLQLNVENLLDEEYWGTAHNDNNITPGSPRAFRVALRTRF